MAGFFKNLFSKFRREVVDWEELEEALIAGDLGVGLTMGIVETLQGMGRKLKGEDIVEVARRKILEVLPAEVPPLEPLAGKPKVLLIVGVNGTGKTTSTAKLALHLKKRGFGVVLAAADTFRAAAIEQLDVWSGRIGVPLVKGPYKSDPSAVCFDAYDKAEREGADFLICDTAGRLHTRHNLMEELRKVYRTLGKKDAESPHETLLVVDATTGGNALSQAREFHKALTLTGVIVTKLDGSGKGGVVAAIQSELGVPARFIGTGEKAGDFEAFDAGRFVGQLL